MAIFTQAQWRAFKNCSIDIASRDYESIKRNFMNGQVGKATRPWFVLDFSQLLPADSTMVGWELEGGFDSAQGLTEFMNWLWDNTDYVTADHEGCRAAPVEITFPPFTMEQMLDSSNPIREMFAYNESLPANRRFGSLRVTEGRPSGGCIGSHVNISTAAYRSASNDVRSSVIRSLQSFFGSLTRAKRYALQGRQPYTEHVASGRGGMNGSQTDGCERIEFKMFHTTTNQQQFNNYCLVAKRLAEVIDMLIAHSFGNRSMFDYLTQDLPNRTVIVETNDQYERAIYNESCVAPGYVPPVEAAQAA